MNMLIHTVALGFAAGTAHASVVSYEFEFQGLQDTSDPVIFTLPGLNSVESQTLSEIRIQINTLTKLTHAFENPTQSQWTIENVYTEFGTSVLVDAGAFVQGPNVSINSGEILLDAADGVPLSGNDYQEFGVQDWIYTYAQSITDDWVLDAVINGDGINLSVQAASLLLLSGGIEVYEGTVFEQSGTLRIDYVIDSVPAPSALSLFSFAFFVNRPQRTVRNSATSDKKP